MLIGISHAQQLDWNKNFGSNGTITVGSQDLGNASFDIANSAIHLGDGKLLVSVQIQRTYLRRLLPDGSPDNSFGNNGYSKAFQVTDARFVQLGSGKILLVGTSVAQPRKLQICRLFADGTLDAAFGDAGLLQLPFPDANARVMQTMEDEQGNILLFAYSNLVAPQTVPVKVYRLHPDGLPDNSFGNGGMLSLNPENQILVHGAAIYKNRIILTIVTNLKEVVFFAFGLDGQPDKSFGTNGMVESGLTGFEYAAASTILSDGSIVAAAISNGWDRNVKVIKLNADGQPDPAFGVGGSITFGNTRNLITIWGVQRDGQDNIMILHRDAYSNELLTCTKIDKTGTLVSGYGNNGQADFKSRSNFYEIRSVDVGKNGQLLLAGWDNNNNYTGDYFVSSLDENGGPDHNIGADGVTVGYIPTASSFISEVQTGTDGSLMGRYVSQSTNRKEGLVRIAANGKVDSAFGVNSLLSVRMKGYTRYKDGRFITYDMLGFTDWQFTRYKSNGTVDSSYGTNGASTLNLQTNFDIRQIATTTDNKLIVCGYSWDWNKTNFFVLRLHPDGQLDKEFGNGGIVYLFSAPQSFFFFTLKVLADGALLIGGRDHSNTTESKFYLTRLLPNGTKDFAFGDQGVIYGFGQTGSAAIDIMLQKEDDLIVKYLAGPDPNAPNSLRIAYARFNNKGVAYTNFANEGNLITDDKLVVLEDGRLLHMAMGEGPYTGMVKATVRQANGGLDSSFGINAAAYLPIAAINSIHSLHQQDQNIYLLSQQVTEFTSILLVGALQINNTAPKLNGFTLVNATSDKDLQGLETGATINIAAIRGKRINIRANSTNAASVVLQLSGQQQRIQKESELPFALFGNTGNNYWSWTPEPGNYTLVAIPYSGAKGSGTPGTPKEIQFTITDELALSGFTLINAATNRAIRPLTDGAVIDLAQTPDISIRANTGVGYTESVRFGVNETATVRMENAPPFALAGDVLGDYTSWMVTPGTYTITATPYSYNDGQGKSGTPLTLNIQVVNSTPRGPVISGSRQPELNTAELQVYPNPVAGDAILSFTAATSGAARILIIDAVGNRIQELRPGNTQHGSRYQLLLPMGRLPKGVYNIVVSENGINRIVPIIRQ